jgi:hypothetical protein
MGLLPSDFEQAREEPTLYEGVKATIIKTILK